MSPLCDFHSGRTRTRTRCRFFSLGFTRQGTRSLCVAANMLGIKAAHGFGGCEKCEEDAGRRAALGRTNFHIYRAYEASFQTAAVHWEKLVDERPDAKFILPMRPMDSWLDSCDHRCVTVERTHWHLPWFHFERYKLYGQYLYNRDVWAERWLRHVERVHEKLDGTGRLLVVNVFEDCPVELWIKLAGFFGVPVPDPLPEFPHKVGLMKSDVKRKEENDNAVARRL